MPRFQSGALVFSLKKVYYAEMATSLTLMSKLISMLLCVIIGYVVVRIRLLKASDSKPLSTLVAFVLQPALIIHAMQIELTPERTAGFITAALFTSAIYILWIVMTKLLKKPLSLAPVDETTLCYSNVGNLMLPVISMVLGEEMVFYAAAIQIPFNLFIWTHGASTIGGGSPDGESSQALPFTARLVKILRNPNLIALTVGLILMILGLSLPEILYTSAEYLTGAVAPVSMLVVGMVIAEKNLKQIFLWPRAWGILLGRLIFFPAATMLLLAAIGIPRIMPQYVQVLQVVFLCLSAPPASTVSQLAVIYDEEPFKASAYNTLGMFLCIVTIPLMNLLYQALFH